MTPRRSKLGAIAVAVAALAIASRSALLSHAAPLDNDGLILLRRDDSSAALRSCLDQARSDGRTFDVVYPNEGDYDQLSTSYNPAKHYKPALVASPANVEDVQAIVRCVADQDGRQKLTPKGGGHSYEAYSYGGQDGSVMLDLRKMNTIQVDTDAKSARVGGGVRLGALASELYKHGFALPHGTCPYVGVSGHALGGGFGFATRDWGFLMDRIVSMDLVKVDGSVSTIDAQSDPDLFFALRGAGANNFGVVTSFVFALEHAPESTVNYAYSYKSNEDCAKLLVALQDLTLESGSDSAAGLPPAFGGELLVTGPNTGDFDNNACQLSGQHVGVGVDEHRGVVERLHTRAQVQPASASANTYNWLDSLTNIMGSLDVSSPSSDTEQFYARSLVQPYSATYTYDTALRLFDKLSHYAGIEGTGNSISFDFLGPRAAKSAPESASNAHDAIFINQFYSYAFPLHNDNGQQDRVYAAFDDLVDTAKAAAPNAPWGAYVNYVDSRLQNWASAYYGNKLDRLKQIKASLDPQTVFDFPQGLAHA